MSDRVRCNCRRCVIRGLMGPAIVITVGVLFLLGETNGGNYDFGRTFPVILIVMGAISLASALAPMDGHITSSAPPVAAPGASGSAPAPQNPISGQGQ
ncbi:MAG: hypothetical protein ACRD36_08250 [Candidatus Acidiferrum sp.]